MYTSATELAVSWTVFFSNFESNRDGRHLQGAKSTESPARPECPRKQASTFGRPRVNIVSGRRGNSAGPPRLE